MASLEQLAWGSRQAAQFDSVDQVERREDSLDHLNDASQGQSLPQHTQYTSPQPLKAKQNLSLYAGSSWCKPEKSGPHDQTFAMMSPPSLRSPLSVKPPGSRNTAQPLPARNLSLALSPPAPVGAGLATALRRSTAEKEESWYQPSR